MEKGETYFIRYDYDWLYSEFVLLDEKTAMPEIKTCLITLTDTFVATPERFWEDSPDGYSIWGNLIKPVLLFLIRMMWWLVHILLYVIAFLIALFHFPVSGELSFAALFQAMHEAMWLLHEYDHYIVLAFIFAVIFGAIAGGGTSSDDNKTVEELKQINEHIEAIKAKLGEQ